MATEVEMTSSLVLKNLGGTSHSVEIKATTMSTTKMIIMEVREGPKLQAGDDLRRIGEMTTMTIEEEVRREAEETQEKTMMNLRETALLSTRTGSTKAREAAAVTLLREAKAAKVAEVDVAAEVEGLIRAKEEWADRGNQIGFLKKKSFL